MNQTSLILMQGVVVEEEVRLTLVELCQTCSAEEAQVLAWVHEGALEPAGGSPSEWSFSGESLRRARLAQRLSCDLELNPPGVALALDLLDEIAELRARLRRAGVD